MFDAPRRRRRRRLMWPVLATLVVGVGVIVATSGSDARATITYLEEMRTASSDLSRAGASMTALVADLSRVDRAEFESVIGGVEAALARAGEVAAVEQPSQDLIGAATLYRLAVDSWEQGMDGFGVALLEAADNPSSDTVVDELASAVVLVRAGDRIYDALVAELGRPDVPSPVTDMPEVRLLPVDAPVTVLAPAWVSAARSATSRLALRPSVRIEQVATRPEWVTNTDGILVVPATDTVDVVVVVGNDGNVGAEVGNLRLTLLGPDGDPLVLTEEVPEIAAGAQTSITFSQLAVAPGSDYRMEALLTPGGGDMFLDDNRHASGFTVNAATEG